MSIAKAYTAHIIGLEMETITVEVDISNGLHSFSVVGLGDRAVEEAKDRVAAAIKNTGYVSPKQKNQKVVLSLAPADIRKEGPSFDLAMSIAYLKGAGDIDFEYEHTIFLGELSLEGTIRKVHGLLPVLTQAPKHGFTTVFVPKENETEASLSQGLIIYAVSSLKEVINHLNKVCIIKPTEKRPFLETAKTLTAHDISLVRGNETAKRALEIAVAGCHNILLFGPPGTGKSMLAQSVISILPPLTYNQAVEVTSIHSVARTLNDNLITIPPFRSPHHSASAVAMLGGGSNPHPGEITLAHRGVLYMDEFPEFERDVLESLRQPLEDKLITIARARKSVTFPAQCILIASMNPCRCGKGKDNGCTCSPKNIDSYRRRISAPILDRFDLWVEVSKIDYDKISAQTRDGEGSDEIRSRVITARSTQEVRLHTNGVKYFNGEMTADDIEKYAFLDPESRKTLALSAERLQLSGRAFHKIIKVARTIADLENSKNITKKHILEALQYRQKLF